MRFRTPELFLGALLAVAIFAIGMLFAASTLQPNQQDVAVTQQQSREKITNEGRSAPSLWIPTDSVGLYTLVLAIFTGLLALVSSVQGVFLLRADRTARIAADAARLSAEAAIAIEGARLLCLPQNHNYWDAVGSWANRWPNSPQMGPLRNTVEANFAFKNYGKTPAALKEVRACLEHRKEPPQMLGASAPYLGLPIERIIGEGLLSPNFKLEISHFFTMAEAIAMNNDEGAIWLRGSVVYDDVFGREGTQWFVYRLNRTGGFIPFFERSSYGSIQTR